MPPNRLGVSLMSDINDINVNAEVISAIRLFARECIENSDPERLAAVVTAFKQNGYISIPALMGWKQPDVKRVVTEEIQNYESRLQPEYHAAVADIYDLINEINSKGME